ncbi:MAG: preprotein translocase subunit SecA, partial [Bacteroidaceae bacterium]|nr:preprotein translocase subunit SecA [Bacteroidaceae bacterium]
MGFNEFISKLFGNKASRDMREIQPWVEKVKAVYPTIAALSNDELRAATQALKEKIQNTVTAERAKIAELKAGIEDTELEKRESVFNQIDKLEKEVLEKLDKALDEALPEAFAIVKDSARRFAENEEVVVTATDADRNFAAKFDFVTIDGDKAIYRNHWQAGGNDTVWNMVHYDVQLFGGVVLHKGKIAEMATGEGKTLVATLPVFLNALTGNGVHVVTVNDYLAKRDSEWMGPLYMFHGLTVDCIDKHQPNSDARRRAYLADITFGTNNEFGFDYLRDNMATQPDDLVQRQHNYAIVDEVDSVLIDDARTPLIISGPVPRNEDQLFEEYRPLVERLVEAQKKLATQFLAEARTKIYSENKDEVTEGYLSLFRSHKALPKNKALIKLLSEPGVKTGLIKTEEFYMEQNNRRMPEATEPLYFVIDEKHNSVDLTDKGIELITGNASDQNLFVLPDIASELSMLENNDALTAEEKIAKKDEMLTNFAIKSERVHTINQLLKAYTMFDRDVEYVVTEDGQVKIVDEQTGRIMDGRRYSDGLHQAIEAKERVKVEAASQTFATITLQNYFRMYHKLAGMTGTAETEAGEFWDIYKLDVVVIPTNRPIARNDMNDRIYKTKREKYNAVIEEISNLVKQGRPVLVGTTSVEISELLSRLLTIRKIPHNVLNAKLHQKEADIVAKAGLSGTVTIATNMAGRGTDIKLSDEVKAAGGLAIIGTERHESRRVDRQLRGRSGRQGDPGSSVFFVSLEDNLMRLFGSERISKVLDNKYMGFQEGDVIEHSMISKSIERAQKKVEENNFGIRKRLLEYDDVMNKQRTVIYTKRRHALIGERIGMDIVNMVWDRCCHIVEDFTYEDAKMEMLRLL